VSVSLDPWSVDSCVLHVYRLIGQRFLGSYTEKVNKYYTLISIFYMRGKLSSRRYTAGIRVAKEIYNIIHTLKLIMTNTWGKNINLRGFNVIFSISIKNIFISFWFIVYFFVFDFRQLLETTTMTPRGGYNRYICV